MEENASAANQDETEAEQVGALEQPAARRRLPWPLLVVAVIFVAVAFTSWYGSWFGRTLSDSQIQHYLNDTEKPRDAQHALTYIGDRIMAGDKSVRKWYPAVIASAENPTPQVRLWAAWVMGQDNTYEDFHKALLPLLKDPDAGVRHNAALGLVRFSDASGRSELTAMLESKSIRAQIAGTAELIVDNEGVQVATGAPLVRIKADDGRTVEVHAQEESRVESLYIADGARTEEGMEMLRLAPSTDEAWEALRALYFVGQVEDLRIIEPYARPLARLPERIQQQAAATIEAIRVRARSNEAGVKESGNPE